MLHFNWKRMFPPHILQRGKDYYEDERVLLHRWYGSKLIADVEGTEIYTVSVTFDAAKKEITAHSCDCPYGEDGTPCKHLAAVLYSLDCDDDTETAEEPRTALSIEGLVDMLSEAQMKTLLVQLAENDSYVWEKIQLLATNQLPNTQKNHWAPDLRRITNSATDRYGYIAYEDAYDYCYKLVEYLENHVPDLIETKLFDDAFELVCMVFHEAADQEMDDSDGGLTIVASSCMDAWSEILDAADLDTHKKMLQWFQEHCYDSEMGEMFLEDYIFDAPWDASLSTEILRLIDEWPEQTEDAYYHEQLILKKLRWLKESGADASEIAEYIAEYDYLPQIRDMQVSQALRECDYETALSLLAESKAKHLNSSVLAAKYSEQMIGIYEKTNDIPHLREELEYYIFNCTQNNLEYIEKMKQLLTPTEWDEMRGRLLVSPSMSRQRFPLMEQEGMYKEILEQIEAKSDFYTFTQYEHLLMKEYPRRCANLLVRYLQTLMNRASDRNAYRSLMQTLKRLLKYPDGQSIAQQIADNWKREYSRRSALLDEMRKAGF